MSHIPPRFIRIRDVITAIGGLALLSGITYAQDRVTSETAAELHDRVQEEIRALTIDSGRIMPVRGFFLEKEGAALIIDSGTAHLMKPVNGRPFAAVIRGPGVFRYSSPSLAERKSISRFLGEEHLAVPVKGAVIYALDGTIEQMMSVFPALDGMQVDPDVQEIYRESLSRLEYPEDFGLYPMLKEPFIRRSSGTIFIHLLGTEPEPLAFGFDPEQEEEVGLYIRPDAPGRDWMWEQFSSSHTFDELSSRQIDSLESFGGVDVQRYLLEASLDGDAPISVVAELDLRLIEPEREWASFHLAPVLQIDSAFWGDGSAIDLVHLDGWNTMIRLASRPDPSTANARIRLHYRGKYIERNRDWFYLWSSINWYPKFSGRDKAIFDLTYHVPDNYEFVSIGALKDRSERGGVVSSRWVTDHPVRNASFNIGFFEEHVRQEEGLPPMHVWMSRYGHGDIAEFYSSMGITSGANMKERIGDDVAASIKLYEFLYGPYPADKIFVTEIPGSHGEAFPGLIHISWSTFQREDGDGWDHRFRAHEVAHQWWGANGVDYLTYRDQWLSEGFSDYSSLLYLQGLDAEKRLFLGTLRRWRDELVDAKWRPAGKKSVEPGPISLGYRLGTSRTPGDYHHIVYKKGAWVLHMLRSMMLDMKTLSDQRYRDMMKDFYQQYQGKLAGTDDFQRVVGEHFGQDMSWFFDQWVHGTAIPSYRWDYELEETPDGRYLIDLTIEQHDVPDGFQVYMPVTISYGNAGESRLHVHVQGSGGLINLPPLPMKPKEVRINDFEGVLGTVERI